MKKMLLFLISGLCFLTSFPAFAEVTGSARLSFIHGEVAMQTQETSGEWTAASINMPVLPGNKLWVHESGKAEIQFLGGTYLRATYNSYVDITRLKIDNSGNVIQVAVPQGKAYINYKGSNIKNSVFQVDTPSASAMAYSPSKFRVDVNRNGQTEISVFSGSIYVESRSGSTKVEAGNTLSVGSGEYAVISSLKPTDDWDRWNRSRDSEIETVKTSRQYLPSTLEVYGSDFDTYGRWVYTTAYGYVWSPIVVISNWSPYRSGRWVWTGGDYVWVSYEPWGWAPYHYGRWAFRRAVGWFWVPPHHTAVYWSPGYVAWIHTPSYVCWVPLAPKEIYYGYGYYGPYSVNLTKVNIKNVNVTNVYSNSTVTNAVTIVNRNTFINGTPATVTGVQGNPFKAGAAVSPGRPDITPVKAASSPFPMKVVPQKKLPPSDIETKSASVLNRPAAATQSISVFKHGKKSSPMQVNKTYSTYQSTPEYKQQESNNPSVSNQNEKTKSSFQTQKVKPHVQKGEKVVKQHVEKKEKPERPAEKEQDKEPNRYKNQEGKSFNKGGAAGR